MPLVYSLLIIEWLAFACALYYSKYLVQQKLVYLIVLLGVVAIGETIGIGLKLLDAKTINNYFYSCFLNPAQNIILFKLYDIKNKATPISFFTATIILLVALIIENIWLQNFTVHYCSITFLVSSILLLAYVFTYIFNLLKSDDILHFRKDIYFYISAGLLLALIPSIPYYSFLNYLKGLNQNLYIYYWYVLMCLSCLMYLLIAAGIIKCQSKN
jgi:hypothetical protein